VGRIVLVVPENRKMSQSEFVSLPVQCELADSSLDANESAVNVISLNIIRCFLPQDSYAMEDDNWHAYVSVSESPTLTVKTHSDCVDLNALPVSQTMFEPARCPNDLAPPKRFYRTYWRSSARRILELARLASNQTAERENSDLS
jgi:hypothetical protein